MTDLTIDRATELDEPVRDALATARAEQPAAELPQVPVFGGVRLASLLALARLTPAQAVEVGTALLAAADEEMSLDGGPAVDRAVVGSDGRVVLTAGSPEGSSRDTPQGLAAVLAQVARASRAREAVGAALLDELDGTVAELPVAGVPAARQRLEKACAAVDRPAVRAELGALAGALAESTGAGAPGGAVRARRLTESRSEAPLPQATPASSVRRRLWAWLLSIVVLVAVVALEVVLLRDEIAADVHLLLEAGRSGSTASTVPEPDGLPVTPPAPPAAGAVAAVDVRPVRACTPGAPCTVRILLRLLPAADPRTVSWSFQLTDRCTGAMDTRPGGTVTVPAGAQQAVAVDTVALPAYRAVAMVAVTGRPAVAAAPPVLLGSCASDLTTG